MKISILGTGRWASCIGLCLDRQNYNVLMYERKHSDRPQSDLFLTGKNRYVALSKNVSYTTDLEQAINYGDVIVISILSQQLDNFMQSIKQVPGYENKKYVLAMKGIEATTGRRLSEILIDNGVKRDNIAVWVGPGHVQSIANGQPTNMIISAYDRVLAEQLVKAFTDKYKIDISYSTDIVGTEIGAAAKNVIGIAAGILEGSKLEQKKGPLMPASVREIGKFIDAVGGEAETSYGLAFLGDFQATLFDHNSKNLTYGKTIVEQQTTDTELIKDFVDVNSVEGIMTAKALIKRLVEVNSKISNEKQIRMPITQAVNDIIDGKVDISTAGEYMSKQITEALNLD